MEKIEKIIPSGWKLVDLMEAILNISSGEYIVTDEAKDIENIKKISSYYNSVELEQSYDLDSSSPLYCIKCNEIFNNELYTYGCVVKYNLEYNYNNFKIVLHKVKRFYECRTNIDSYTSESISLYVNDIFWGSYDDGFTKDVLDPSKILKMCENEDLLVEKVEALSQIMCNYTTKDLTFNHLHDLFTAVDINYLKAKSFDDLNQDEIKLYDKFVKDILNAAEFLYSYQKPITIKSKSIKLNIYNDEIRIYVGALRFFVINKSNIYKYMFSPMVWLLAQIMNKEKTMQIVSGKITYYIYLPH